MELIQCPECKTKIRNRETVCPECGYNLARHQDNVEKAKRIIRRRERQKRISYIVIPMITVAVIVCGSIAINTAVLSKRMTFSSQQKMIEYLKGDWNETYASNQDGYIVLKIDENGEGEYIGRISEGFIRGECYKNIEYHYKRGYIALDDGEFILKNDSTIQFSNSPMVLKPGKPGNESDIQQVDDIMEVTQADYEIVGETAKLSYSIINKTDKNVGGTIVFELKDDNGKIIETITDSFSFEGEADTSTINGSLKKTTTRELQQAKSYVAYIKNWYYNTSSDKGICLADVFYCCLYCFCK